MGGNIGFIIKKENGEQIGMSRWTNIMPHFFKNINLYLGNTSAWYDEFACEWLKMKDDYEKNKDTGDFKLNMTPVYFPNPTQSPDEYGIVVVDLQNKKIYSSQDYTNVGSLAFYHMWSGYGDNEEDEALIRQYFEHGLIKEIGYYDRTKRSYEKMDISGVNVDDIIQLLQEAVDHQVNKFSHPLFAHLSKKDLDMYSSHFLINSQWQFTTHDDRDIGVLKVKKEIDANDFIFTEQDNTAWKEYLSYRWEDADEENEDFQEFKKLYLEVFNEQFVVKAED